MTWEELRRGDDLDAIVAREVMGWRRVAHRWIRSDGSGRWTIDFRPSRNITSAVEMLGERFIAEGWFVALEGPYRGDGTWRCSLSPPEPHPLPFVADHVGLTMAACIAALRAVGWEPTDEAA